MNDKALREALEQHEYQKFYLGVGCKCGWRTQLMHEADCWPAWCGHAAALASQPATNDKALRESLHRFQRDHQLSPRIMNAEGGCKCYACESAEAALASQPEQASDCPIHNRTGWGAEIAARAEVGDLVCTCAPVPAEEAGTPFNVEEYNRGFEAGRRSIGKESFVAGFKAGQLAGAGQAAKGG